MIKLSIGFVNFVGTEECVWKHFEDNWLLISLETSCVQTGIHVI